jgi:hypothetical protein
MRCIRSLRRSSFMSRKLLKSSKSDQKLVCLNMLISVCLRTAKKAKRISTKRCWIQLKTWFRVLGKCCKRRLTLWTEKMRWKHHEKLSFWVRCLDCLGIRGLSLTGMFSSLGMFWRRVITEWWRLRNEFLNSSLRTNVSILKRVWSYCLLDLQG